MRTRLIDTHAGGWTLLVRLLIGLIVFLPEGIQKLAFPEVLGAGRFAQHRPMDVTTLSRRASEHSVLLELRMSGQHAASVDAAPVPANAG